MSGTDGDWFAEGTATLGDRIAAARAAAGLTQADCARRLGVRQATLAGWEEDRAEPRANRLQMLAAMLGVSLRWMMTGAGDGPAPAEAAMPPGLRAALGELRGLSAEARRLSDRIAAAEARLRALAGAGA